MAKHFDAIRLENACRSAINADSRGALYGMVDADNIGRVGNALSVLAISVAPYFKEGTMEDRERIEAFLDDFKHLGYVDYDADEYSSELVRAADALRDLIQSF